MISLSLRDLSGISQGSLSLVVETLDFSVITCNDASKKERQHENQLHVYECSDGYAMCESIVGMTIYTTFKI